MAIGLGPLATVGGITTGLNMLGGMFNAGSQDRLRRQLMDLLSSGSLGNEANNIFDTFRRSPMYSGLRTRAMVGSQAMANQMQTGFARAGLGRSGVASLAMPIARNSVQGGLNDIDMNLFAEALQQARSLLEARANVMRSTANPGALGMGIGGSLESLMPLLSYWLDQQKKKGT